MVKVKPAALLSAAAILLCFITNIEKNVLRSVSSVSLKYQKDKPLCGRDNIREGKWLGASISNSTSMASSGTNSPGQYQWLPYGVAHNESAKGWCRYRLKFDTDLFCRLCTNMAIMFIGDSLNWELYQSLVHLLGAEVYEKVKMIATFQKTTIMINVCGGNNVTLIYRWSKQLVGQGTSVSIDQMLEEQFPTMIILNTGAHYQPDNQYRGNVKNALDKMAAWQKLCRSRNLTCPFFWKTSVPGIPYCKNFTEPVNDIHRMELHVALNPIKNYKWDKFKDQNEIAMQLLNESQLDYNVLDAYELGIQRPELHVSDKDCLHSYDLAVSDAINTVLLHYLESTRTMDDVSRMANYKYDFDRSTNVSPDGYGVL